MGDYTPKMAKVASVTEALEPGETLVAGCRAMSKGGFKGVVGGMAGGFAGGAVGHAIGSRAGGDERAEGQDQASAVGIPELPNMVILGLTDRRFLIFSRTAMTGKPKALLAAIPRSSIASIAGEDSGSKLKPDRLTVSMASGGSIDFDAVKADGYERLVEAFGS